MRHPPGMTRALTLLLSLVAVVVMAPVSPGSRLRPAEHAGLPRTREGL